MSGDKEENDMERYFSSSDEDPEMEYEEEYGEEEEEEEEDEGANANITPRVTTVDKDSEEQELEDLVLGGRNDFRKLLHGEDFMSDVHGLTKGKELQLHGGSEGLEDVPDSDFMAFDHHGHPGDTQKPLSKRDRHPEKKSDGGQPAWIDSDDERLNIAVTTDMRRKWKMGGAEDTISGVEYSQRLRERFLTLNPLPKWAQTAQAAPQKRRRRSSASSRGSLGSDEDEDGGTSTMPLNEFLRSVRQLSGANSAQSRPRLRPEVIDIQRSRDIPDTYKGYISSICFHPSLPILLTASVSSIMYLHHIDAAARPTPHPKLTSVQARQVDIRRAEFLSPAGDKIFFAGRKRFFHTWNIESGLVQRVKRIVGHQHEHWSMEHFRLSPCGRYMAVAAVQRTRGGDINILNAVTCQWIASARLDGKGGVADFVWWRSGGGMTILGKDGWVGEWSMARGMVDVWKDEGCVEGLVVALGGHHGPPTLGGDRWVAVGSKAGIVNVYERSNMIEESPEEMEMVTMKERPVPTRAFQNLVTPITSITFSPDGQLLVFCSRYEKDALKLVHLPSCTVYRNWPTDQTPLGRISSVAIGPGSDMLAVGNDVGKVRLWEIRR